MDNICAPAYADIFMADLEEKIHIYTYIDTFDTWTKYLW